MPWSILTISVIHKATKEPALLKDIITKDDLEFATFTSDKWQGYEMDFTKAAKKTAVDSDDDVNWSWDDDFQELRSGPPSLVEKIKACEKEKKDRGPS